MHAFPFTAHVWMCALITGNEEMPFGKFVLGNLKENFRMKALLRAVSLNDFR